MATEDVLAAWRRRDPDLADPVTRWTVAGNVTAPLTDLGEGRLRDMDVAGVDTAVLSLTTPGLQSLPRAEAVALQGPTNDVIADAVRRHPDRLHGFATLATPDPGAAARELGRAVTELGLDGAMLHSLTDGRFHDDHRYWDLFEAAEHLRAPIYLHPAVPPPAVTAAYYDGFGLLRTGGVGWHFQTGVALLRLVLAGVFDRFPHLQVVLGHWGETVLFFLDRSALLDGASGLDRPLADYVRQNVFITPGGVASHRYLRWATEVVGIDRIMHATDYPFNGPHDFDARGFLADAPLSDDDRARVASGTWDRLRAGIRR
ncbi:amidohydrolase family protein [Pseudonocardia sp. ICBG1122]|nr:amidohydrolase family protein [Pseudonocardia pini]